MFAQERLDQRRRHRSCATMCTANRSAVSNTRRVSVYTWVLAISPATPPFFLRNLFNLVIPIVDSKGVRRRMDADQPFTWAGVILIVLGIILVALPLLGKYVSDLERLPWIIVWIYRRNGFYFATSPLLIIISIISIILNYLNRTRG